MDTLITFKPETDSTVLKLFDALFPDPKKWLEDNLGDIATNCDSVSCVLCESRKVDKHNQIVSVTIKDYEENLSQVVNIDRLIDGLKLLMGHIYRGILDKNGQNQYPHSRLYVSGWRCVVDMVDPCNWDVESSDAFFQLCMYSEVRYG